MDPQIWLSLLTLTLLEVILGIDNLVFISIITSRVPQHRQTFARRIGLVGALVMRLLFLAGIFWLITLTQPLFSLFSHPFSARDMILIAGGLFLLVKGTTEIHNVIEGIEEGGVKVKQKNMYVAISQIMLFDIIFSLDSIMTAVGLTDHYWIMAVAIIIAIIAMLFASEPLHRFIHSHPTIKMLALSFLILIGAVLIADGFQYHIPREYIYFSISFSIFVELMNNLARRKRKKQRVKSEKVRPMQ